MGEHTKYMIVLEGENRHRIRLTNAAALLEDVLAGRCERYAE